MLQPWLRRRKTGTLSSSINARQPIYARLGTALSRMVHFFSRAQLNDVSARSLLSSTHTIKFKKVQSGPPPQKSQRRLLS